MTTTTQTEIFDRQQPLGTGLGATTTAEQVIQGISLKGKTAIVTGGYSGIGLETVRVLRDAGARVIVPTRSIERARDALVGIDAVIEPMDLLDPASIDDFAQRFLDDGAPLDLLINSAGIMALPERTLDPRGYELQFATNHLGHFQLTTRLLPALRRAEAPRVVSVSSWGHHFSPVLFDDHAFETTPYDAWAAYGQSKTANILFALALNERFKHENLRAYSVHPGGIVGTNLARHVDFEQFRAMGVIDENGNPIIDPERNLKTIPQGAAPLIWCAVSPDLTTRGGVYCENCDIAQLEDDGAFTVRDFGRLTRHDGLLPYAVDLDAAERLWTLSETLVFGVHA